METGGEEKGTALVLARVGHRVQCQKSGKSLMAKWQPEHPRIPEPGRREKSSKEGR